LVNFGCAKNPVIIGKHLSESGKIAAKKRVEHITKLQNAKMCSADVRTKSPSEHAGNGKFDRSKLKQKNEGKL